MRLIDADKLKQHFAWWHEGGEEADRQAEIFEQIIDVQPTIEERKKGEWIRHSIGHENTPWGFDCSACGKWFVIGDDTANEYVFCPHCGARMEVEDEID